MKVSTAEKTGDQLLAELFRMAEEWKCRDNPLIASGIRQYVAQMEIVLAMKREIATLDSFTTEKQYISGKDNAYTHPLIDALPKHADSATKTYNSLVTAITKLGIKPVPHGGRLEALASDNMP